MPSRWHIVTRHTLYRTSLSESVYYWFCPTVHIERVSQGQIWHSTRHLGQQLQFFQLPGKLPMLKLTLPSCDMWITWVTKLELHKECRNRLHDSFRKPTPEIDRFPTSVFPCTMFWGTASRVIHASMSSRRPPQYHLTSPLCPVISCHSLLCTPHWMLTVPYLWAIILFTCLVVVKSRFVQRTHTIVQVWSTLYKIFLLFVISLPPFWNSYLAAAFGFVSRWKVEPHDAANVYRVDWWVGWRICKDLDGFASWLRTRLLAI